MSQSKGTVCGEVGGKFPLEITRGDAPTDPVGFLGDATLAQALFAGGMVGANLAAGCLPGDTVPGFSSSFPCG